MKGSRDSLLSKTTIQVYALPRLVEWNVRWRKGENCSIKEYTYGLFGIH